MIKFSAVVPVYNEANNLVKLHKELLDVLERLGTYEIIYVDDGSDDATAQTLRHLHPATTITLQRNYGQSVALDVGLKQARGEYLITIDADLQNDPQDIPRLYRHLRKHRLDVVAGWRQKRHDPLLVRAITRVARILRRILVNDGVHDSGCTLRVYRRDAARSLDLWGEMHRYVIALLRWKGFRIGEIPVNHRPRYRGKSKYTSLKAINGFTDLLFMWFINKYSRRPLHLFGLLSLLLFFAGMAIEAWMAYLKLFRGASLSDNAFFPLGFFMILIALLLFVSGVLIDIMLRSYYNTAPIDRRYRIKEIRRT